jgi:hypothetical protein
MLMVTKLVMEYIQPMLDMAFTSCCISGKENYKTNIAHWHHDCIVFVGFPARDI